MTYFTIQSNPRQGKGINLNNWRHWVIAIRLSYAWLIKFSCCSLWNIYVAKADYVIFSFMQCQQKFYSNAHEWMRRFSLTIQIKSRKSHSTWITKFTRRSNEHFRLSWAAQCDVESLLISLNWEITLIDGVNWLRDSIFFWSLFFPSMNLSCKRLWIMKNAFEDFTFAWLSAVEKQA